MVDLRGGKAGNSSHLGLIRLKHIKKREAGQTTLSIQV
jgi:hypothetical protein